MRGFILFVATASRLIYDTVGAKLIVQSSPLTMIRVSRLLGGLRSLAPFSSLIATMAMLGWRAWRPDVWIDPAGSRFVFTHLSAVADFKAVVSKHVEALLWRRASAHEYGSGLEGGCHTEVSFNKYLRCKDVADRWGLVLSPYRGFLAPGTAQGMYD